ncbi:hypothetical protein V3C99_015643, partial [Haemonchus contortus]
MDFATNLLSLRDFTLVSTWPQLAAITKEEFDDWLAERGLLWKDRPCPCCGNPRKVSKQKSSYLFAYDLGTTKEMARTLEVDEQTVQQWSQWFRDVLVEPYTNNAVQICRPNTIVQIDETNIVRRNYNVGRVVRKDWLVGSVQDGTKLVFFEIVENRDAATLERIIQQHVAPGETIRTDMWSGYDGLFNLGYTHETVSHSVNFVDPATGVHTQRIEGLWSILKDRIRR